MIWSRFIVFRLAQSLKAMISNFVTLSGNVISVSEVQFWKPPAEILVIHSTLKSREYLAKGLPTIATGMTDVFIGTDYPYNLELPTDTNSVNIQSVISFYDSIYCTKTRQRVIAEIRAFAERHIDMNITMEPVIRYLSS